MCAALVHFGMDNHEASPTKTNYEGTLGDVSELREYLLKNAKQVVQDFVNLDFPVIPTEGYQSNNIACDISDKRYKQAATLRCMASQLMTMRQGQWRHQQISQRTMYLIIQKRV